MQGLDEAYDRRGGGVDRPRHALAGLLLLALGALGVLAATLLVALGGDSTVASAYAGVAAGLGIPAMLLGVVVVLPASRWDRLGVVAGAVVAGLGVALFWRAYPARWIGTAEPLAFETTTLYVTGCAIALWFVFTAIASFRRRNNPQGTVRLEVIRQGQTQTLEVSGERYSDIVSDGGDASRVIRELDDRN